DGPLADVTAVTGSEIDAIQLDPERRAIETRLDDNRAPPELHVLLDSADVEVSSTEFGVSTLLVARRRYDYRKDLAAAGFVTSRSLGANTGVQLHGGAPIDRNLFRHNLFLYYSIQELDRDFRNERAPETRTAGRLGGLGFRYNFYDAFWFENPSLSRHLRVFFDGYDESAGGDFNYVQTGASLTVTTRLREDTVAAAQVLNGFSVSTGSGPVPNQGLFSLGGFRSIRGIEAEEGLAENIFIVRAELRRLLPVRLELNLEDILTARRLQVKGFVDAGRVENRRGRLYDPEGFAVGAGAGINLFYDFLGFFPTSFYLDVATRVDRRSSVQILFGARQAF
ncbi:MAG: BamA/TamA family outer membrane protein, partial [Candidatus Binatia bacterium]